jgi:ABC-type lipoprotein release transport system permease subunit
MGPARMMRIAWRNLWRNRRRTALTLFSIAFGFLLAVLLTAMQDRNWADMIDLAARLGGGHVTVQNEGLLDAPTLSRTVRATSAVAAAARADPDVLRVVTRIVGQTLLSTAHKSQGAAFVAIDPAREDAATLAVADAFSEGAMFSGSDARGIVLGERLAANLGVTLGKKVVYTMTDKHGQIVEGLARVSGIVRTGSPSVDGGLCLLPLDTLRRALGYAADEATEVAVFIRDQRRSDEVAARLGAKLGGDAVALPWHETQPGLAGFIAMKVGGANFMKILIAVLIAAGIFNTLFVSVTERMREFGIMLAIGYSPRDIREMVMLESLWLGLVGLTAGAAITVGPYSYLSATGIDITAMIGQAGGEVAGVAIPPVLKVGIFPENAVLIALSALLATLAAGIYPAWKAGRVEPVETIRLV